MARIIWLLEMEKNPRTLNRHYYVVYRDKFLAHYRLLRYAETHGGILTLLRSFSLRKASLIDSEDPTRDALVALAGVGLGGLKALDLAKLLPPDPYEPALSIMASVRAYFQGTY